MQVKLQACMKARCQGQFGTFCGLRGSQACVIMIAISEAKPTTVNITTAQRYWSHDISVSGFTPVSR